MMRDKMFIQKIAGKYYTVYTPNKVLDYENHEQDISRRSFDTAQECLEYVRAILNRPDLEIAFDSLNQREVSFTACRLGADQGKSMQDCLLSILNCLNENDDED